MELNEITVTLGQERIKRKLQVTKVNCNHPRSGKELKKIAVTLSQERNYIKLKKTEILLV
jgi:hypothetical protein